MHDSFSRRRQDYSTPQHAYRHHGGTRRTWPVPNERSLSESCCLRRFSRSWALSRWLCQFGRLFAVSQRESETRVSRLNCRVWFVQSCTCHVFSALCPACHPSCVASPSHWVRAKGVECRNRLKHAGVSGQIVLIGTSAIRELMLAGDEGKDRRTVSVE